MIYPKNFENKIGFDKIREMLIESCLCAAGVKFVEEMSFLTHFKTIEYQVQITNELKQLLLMEENYPQENYHDATSILEKLKTIGQYPTVEELVILQKSLNTIRLLKSYFAKEGFDTKYPLLSSLAADVKIFNAITDAILSIIDKYGKVKDSASPELKKIRSDIKTRQGSVNQRIQKLIQSAKSSGYTDSDSEVTIRNGRPVIPVLVNFKRKLGGIVHDESATGKTVFIEPTEIVELNNTIKELEYAERREIIKILIDFADNIRPNLDELIDSYSYLGNMDFIRSKARFAMRINGNKPILNNKQVINWKQSTHPLLYLSHKVSGKEIIPLDVNLNAEEHILVISGPNAGGKSVCLKTLGLLQYMLQCGLLVPMSENSETGIFTDIFIDIGDEQSIDNDLSTYSSHLTNMKYFTTHSSSKTLFLIDEFGTGTEPALGGAIAEAILENLIEKKAFGVVTTHYANLKHYASETKGVINGAMMFDTDKIQPLYKLVVGRPGSSFAIDIARKIGLSEKILSKAKDSLGEDHVNFDKHLREIIRDKKYWETKRQKIRKVEKKLDELYEKYGSELELLNKERKTIINQAKSEAKTIVKQANSKVENTIRSIREAQAAKDKTSKLRSKLQEYNHELAKEENNSSINKKINELEKASNNLVKHSREIKKSKKPSQSKEKAPTLQIGSTVQIKGMDNKGEVVKIDGDKITVAFGLMQTTISKSKIERVGEKAIRNIKGGITVEGSVSKRKTNFKSEIDLRGKRANEALAETQQYIDDAIMVACREVRILHGKGNGVLRQLIRDYVKTIDVVKTVRDEHVERGGTGITVVEFDYF